MSFLVPNTKMSRKDCCLVRSFVLSCICTTTGSWETKLLPGGLVYVYSTTS